VLADGFSCRTQISAGKLGREGIHLAQLLAALVDRQAEGAPPAGAGASRTLLGRRQG
jgi:hypothetical protein